MKNLIVIEGKDKYQFENLNELVEVFINKDYYNMSDEEQKKVLELKEAANTMMNNKELFVLDDEFTYVLSLLKTNKIVLLEKTEANIFGKYMKKDWVTDNYIIINKFADEILKKYLGEKNG